MVNVQTPIKSVQTLKGFRDFLPEEAKKRAYVINTFKKVFASFGFDPLETPALEYEDILLGKYGDEGDKLMYRFFDNGQRKVAMRYDQTVPLSRVVAQYQNTLPLPFKRFQIQPVWRAENPQKGRFREFVQCDIDTVGTSSPLADAEIVAVSQKALEKLGFPKFTILINDRTLFTTLVQENLVSSDKLISVIITIDKLKKIGREGVVQELVQKGFSTENATTILQKIESEKPTSRLTDIFASLEKLGVPQEVYQFSPTLARGLDYYTSTIFEIEIENYTAGSVCGGGRYDELIGMFAGKNIPAVGCAFGFDRILDAMEQLALFPRDLVSTKVLVTIFSPKLKEKSLEVVNKLRVNDIAAELYLDENAKMEKQLKYADQKNIPYVLVIGPDEISSESFMLRNMTTREQKKVDFASLLGLLEQ